MQDWALLIDLNYVVKLLSSQEAAQSLSFLGFDRSITKKHGGKCFQ